MINFGREFSMDNGGQEFPMDISCEHFGRYVVGNIRQTKFRTSRRVFFRQHSSERQLCEESIGNKHFDECFPRDLPDFVVIYFIANYSLRFSLVVIVE